MIVFECDSREEPFLEVLPENMCEYTFVVHTKLVCIQRTNVGVECGVEGFHDLVAFQRMSSHSLQAKGSTRLFFSVCDSLGTSVPGCDASSASCLMDESRWVDISVTITSPPPPPPQIMELTVFLKWYTGGGRDEHIQTNDNTIASWTPLGVL
jgi:hypothetical protein